MDEVAVVGRATHVRYGRRWDVAMHRCPVIDVRLDSSYMIGVEVERLLTIDALLVRVAEISRERELSDEFVEQLRGLVERGGGDSLKALQTLHREPFASATFVEWGKSAARSRNVRALQQHFVSKMWNSAANSDAALAWLLGGLERHNGNFKEARLALQACIRPEIGRGVDVEILGGISFEGDLVVW